ncbi:hypothetical protein BU17DRAFT_79385 [Hysterangium stoloniferum]|nr:hypothetical protein BU17DRAFT_79385 [Hysterangium stoloniferum]
MSSSQTIDIYTLSLNLGGSRFAAYYDIVGYTILLYDYFLTIGTEVDLIWPTPRSAGKGLFYATKYSALLDGALLLYLRLAPLGTTPSTCELLYKLSAEMISAGIIVAQFVLAFRTWAVWERNSIVGVSLLCAAPILSCPIGYITYLGLLSVTCKPLSL